MVHIITGTESQWSIRRHPFSLQEYGDGYSSSDTEQCFVVRRPKDGKKLSVLTVADSREKSLNFWFE